MDYSIIECSTFRDARGVLVEFLRADELQAKHQSFGQIYCVTFDRPNQVRGNHFHTRGTEWFGVVEGRLQVVLEDTRSKEREEFILESDAEKFVQLRVGPHVAHAFRNLSPRAVLVDYSSTQYDREDPDRTTYILIEPVA